MPRNTKTPAATSSVPAPTILPARKKGKTVSTGTGPRNVLGPRIYVKQGSKSVRINDPKVYHARQVENRAKGVTSRHSKRYICYIANCNWGVNKHRCEARDHFRGGYHEGEVYDVKKVIEVNWDDWLDDTDLEVSAAATTEEEWHANFDAKKNSIKQEEVEEYKDEYTYTESEQAEIEDMDIEEGDIKEEEI